MRVNSIGGAILTVATLALSQGVHAATFNFNNLSSTVVSNSGITITLSAPSGGSVSNSSAGVGVKANCCDLGGIQNGEILRLSFSTAVNIGDLLLKAWEGPDRLALTWNGGSVDVDTDHNGGSSDDTWGINLTGVNWLELKGNSIGTVATLSGLNNVSITPTVPVPAAAWLMGSGLVALGGIARRRRA